MKLQPRRLHAIRILYPSPSKSIYLHLCSDISASPLLASLLPLVSSYNFLPPPFPQLNALAVKFILNLTRRARLANRSSTPTTSTTAMILRHGSSRSRQPRTRSSSEARGCSIRIDVRIGTIKRSRERVRRTSRRQREWTPGGSSDLSRDGRGRSRCGDVGRGGRGRIDHSAAGCGREGEGCDCGV